MVHMQIYMSTCIRQRWSWCLNETMDLRPAFIIFVASYMTNPVDRLMRCNSLCTCAMWVMWWISIQTMHDLSDLMSSFPIVGRTDVEWLKYDSGAVELII